GLRSKSLEVTWVCGGFEAQPTAETARPRTIIEERRSIGCSGWDSSLPHAQIGRYSFAGQGLRQFRLTTPARGGSLYAPCCPNPFFRAGISRDRAAASTRSSDDSRGSRQAPTRRGGPGREKSRSGES